MRGWWLFARKEVYVSVRSESQNVATTSHTGGWAILEMRPEVYMYLVVSRHRPLGARCTLALLLHPYPRRTTQKYQTKKIPFKCIE